MDTKRVSQLASLGLLTILALTAFQAAQAHAALLYGSERLDLARYMAGLHYYPFSSSEAELTIVLTNLSEPGSAYITGFALNNPDGRITQITPAPDFPAGFIVLGADSPHGAISTGENGDFDFGAALDGDFSGGGDPEQAIGTNFGSDTKAFRFYLSGTDLHLLDEHSFLAQPSHNAAKPGFFIARMAGMGRDGDETTLSVADTWLYR